MVTDCLIRVSEAHALFATLDLNWQWRSMETFGLFVQFRAEVLKRKSLWMMLFHRPKPLLEVLLLEQEVLHTLRQRRFGGGRALGGRGWCRR